MSKPTFSAQDHEFMAQAVRLAELGLYTTDPNPRVGCVLVKDGRVVGEGWHQKAGEPHAERLALAQAAGQAKGATAYVTLEPCCHTGRTGPCSNALIEAGVQRVLAAMVDPNPKVAGQGLRQLQVAGIEVASGLLQTQAEALNPGFIKRMTTGLPLVRCKLAMSLDGRTAMASGESNWITGEDARRDVQLLRARSSAIVTGSGTVLADDPSLNVRLSVADLPGVASEHYLRQPLRIILDSELATPPSAKTLGLAGKVMIFLKKGSEDQQQALRSAGAELVQMQSDAFGLPLREVLLELGRRECNEVLVESGPRLAGSFLQAGLIDELVLYVAPHLMGDGARGLFHLPGLERMAQRVALDIRDIRQVGRDFRITATISQEA